MAEAQALPRLHITVAHASQPGQVKLWELALPMGATVADALTHCRAHGALAAEPVAMGIWGQLVTHATVLQDGDRLELYRSLTVDPKLAKVVEMRYFAGLSEQEIADLLQRSERSVRRDWQKARLFLLASMRED